MSVAKIGGDLIVISILVGGVALGVYFSTNTTTWSAQTILIWGFIAIVALAGIILALLKDAGVKINM